jgi:hypothetical protein
MMEYNWYTGRYGCGGCDGEEGCVVVYEGGGFSCFDWENDNRKKSISKIMSS